MSHYAPNRHPTNQNEDIILKGVFNNPTALVVGQKNVLSSCFLYAIMLD
jgi:hypothetical protein